MARAKGRLAARPSQNGSDEGCFPVRVSPAVIAVLVRQRALYSRIRTGGARVRAKIVPEDNLIGKSTPVRPADVEVVVVRSVAGRRGEGFPAGDAEIALGGVTEPRQALDDARKIPLKSEPHDDVDGRLGDKSGHRGAADMLDLRR